MPRLSPQPLENIGSLSICPFTHPPLAQGNKEEMDKQRKIRKNGLYNNGSILPENGNWGKWCKLLEKIATQLPYAEYNEEELASLPPEKVNKYLEASEGYMCA